MLTDALIQRLLAMYPAEYGHIDSRYLEVHGGLSDASVLLVDVHGVQGNPDTYNGRAYAKLDRTERVLREHQRHQVGCSGMEQHIPDLLLPPLGEVEGYSLLLYRPAQAVIRGAQSLAKALDDYSRNRHTTTRVIRQIEQLVTETLAPWQSVPHLVNGRTLQQPQDILQTLLNRGGKARVDDLAARFQRHFQLSQDSPLLMLVANVWHPNHAIPLPNPLHFTLREQPLPPLRLAQTPMHGDLHGGNIICRLDEDGQLGDITPQLLDLALFEEQGLGLFDLAYLELDLVTRFVPVGNEAEWGDWLALLRYLHSFQVLPQGQPPGKRPGQTWELIKPIRARVQALLNEIERHSVGTAEDYEAAWWLACWGAGLARSRSNHGEAWQRSGALVYAAWALERLLIHWEISPSGIPQTLIWQEEQGLQAAPAAPVAAPQRKGRLWNVPDLADYYLSRPDDLNKLKALLLSHEAAVVTAGAKTKQVAVQGMGGIGKTVLAAMACHEEDVCAAFPDGIFWLTLGTKPQVERLQAQLATWIEGKPAPFSDLDSLRLHLIGLLEGKRCLLVLDDVWETQHTRGFVRLGDGVRLLVTTRKQGIATALNAVSHPLEKLEPQQAREVLSRAAGFDNGQLPAAAEAVIRECNGLPLALAMIGSALRGKPLDRWQTVAKRLKEARVDEIEFESVDSPYNNLWAVVDVSVAELKPAWRARYLEFAVFQDDIPVPEKTLATLWSVEGFDEDETRDVIDGLIDRALLLRDGDGVKLHDLQLDYVRREVTRKQGDLHALHERLLRAYNPEGKPWYEILHDGYLYLQLAYHLDALGRLDELHTLVTGGPAWREAKFKACEGDAAYMNDLLLLLRQYDDPLSAESAVKVAQLRAAQQVVFARTSRYTDTDLKTLVWLNRLGEALSYARLSPDQGKKFEGLLAVYQALLDRSERETLPALTAGINRVEAELVELLPSIVGSVRRETWLELLIRLMRRERTQQAEAAAYTIREGGSRARALSTIAIQMAQRGETQAVGLFEAALTAAQQAEHPSWQVDALLAVEKDKHGVEAMTVSDGYCLALDIIPNIVWSSGRAEALKAVAAALAQAGRWEQAEGMARSIEDAFWRGYALGAVAAALAQAGDGRAGAVFGEAEGVARSIEDADRRGYALGAVAAALAQAGRWEQAEGMARSIEAADRRGDALRAVAAALAQAGDGRAGAVFGEAEGVARSIEAAYWRGDALGVVAAALAQAGRLCRAFNTLGMRSLEDYSQELTRWNDAFERVEEGLFSAVMQATCAILAWEQASWAKHAEALAPRFPHGYALVIGVGEAAEARLSLSVTSRDAASLASFLRKQAGYGKVRVLTNEQATRENIRAGMDWLAAQVADDPDAVALVYYSGHGAQLPDNRYFLVPHDTNSKNLAGTALPMPDFERALANVRARQTVVFLDCCHAGSATLTKDDLPFVLTALDVSAMTSGKGRVLIASCTSEQKSYIRPDAEHSLFTEVLLELLRQPGNVELLTLWQKLRTEVQQRAEAIGKVQTPRLNTADYDSVVLVVNPPEQAAP